MTKPHCDEDRRRIVAFVVTGDATLPVVAPCSQHPAVPGGLDISQWAGHFLRLGRLVRQP